MRAMTMVLVVLCLSLSLTGAFGQTPPTEPAAPKPSAAVQALLDAVDKTLQANKAEEALKGAEQALAAAKQAKDAVGEASALREKAQTLAKLNRADEAAAVWKEAAAAWEHAGEGPGQVEALGQAGALLITTKPDEAKGLLDRALALGKAETKRPLSVAQALHNVGISMYYRRRLNEADIFWKAVIVIREKLDPNSLDMAKSLNNLGTVADDRGDLSAAEDYNKRALEIQEKLAPRSLDVARSLDNLGNVAEDRGDLTAAEDYHKRALALYEKLAPNSLDIAACFTNLGDVADDRGNLTASEDYHKRALALYEKLAPNSLDIANSFNNLGVVARERGDLADAENYYKRALTLQEKLAPNSLEVATSLNHLGVVTWQRGDLSTAEDYYKRALEIQEKLAPRSLDVARSLDNLGLLASDRGDLAAAEDYYKRDLAIVQKLAPNSLEVAMSLNNLGVVAKDREDLSAAEGYYKRAFIIENNLAPNSLVTARSFTNLGNVAWQRGDLAIAENYYKRALIIEEKLAPNSLDVASSLSCQGVIAWQRGDLSAAEDYYKQALAIEEKLAPNSLDVALQLDNLGIVAEKQGKLTYALRSAHQAWNIVRQQAQGVSGDEARQAFGSAKANCAAHLLRYQVALEQTDAAFRTMEQGRAQALQQLLIERRLLAGATDSPVWNVYEKAVRERDKAMATYSNAASAQSRTASALAAAQEPGSKTSNPDIARLETAKKQADTDFYAEQSAYTQARIRADDAWKQIKAAYPRAFARDRNLQELRQALSPGTLYLAFSIGEEKSHLFLLQANHPVQAFVLPIKQKDLEAQVKSLRFELTDQFSDPSSVAQKSYRLFAALFPPTARKEIAAASHLLISPDGPLWSLPFAALVMSSGDMKSPSGGPAANRPAGGETPGGSEHYLGLEKPITYTQSLSLFAQTREERSHLAKGQKPVALVLGDPIFVRSTEVTVVSSPPSPSSKEELSGSPSPQRGTSTLPSPLRGGAGGGVRGGQGVRLSGERGFVWDKSSPPQRLPNTREEAVQVARLYGATPLLDEQATEANLRKHIEQADILHLATHGYFNPSVPMASGILLTPPMVEPPIGETNNDGALQAWEIFSQLHLRAELCVLSACETGLGRNVAGEGVIGLTRALQYAGCRSIVASQWRVDDASAAALMVAFHKSLRQGLNKDEALRRAMAVVRSNAKTAHPYYWAAFFLTGDPDPIGNGIVPLMTGKPMSCNAWRIGEV